MDRVLVFPDGLGHHPDIHELVRARLQGQGFKYCDFDFTDRTEHASRDWYNEGRELKMRGVSASSTDHETQVGYI